MEEIWKSFQLSLDEDKTMDVFAGDWPFKSKCELADLARSPDLSIGERIPSGKYSIRKEPLVASAFFPSMVVDLLQLTIRGLKSKNGMHS